MDDILFFHDDKEQLHSWQQAMTRFLYDELYLTINPHKVRLYPARLGVDFVGYIIYPRSMRLRGSSVRRFKKRYRKQLKELLDNKTSIEQIEIAFDAWSAHAAHANTQQLVKHLKTWQDDYLFVYAIQEYVRKKGIQKPRVQLSLFDEE